MTETAITTTARRIARETSSRKGLTLRWTRDGDLVDIIETGLRYADPKKAPHADFATSADGTKMTWRDAQDILDAYDAYPHSRADQAMYLLDLRDAREEAR